MSGAATSRQQLVVDALDPRDEILSAREAAAFLKVARSTFDTLPVRRAYIGRRVVVLRSWLIQFVREREFGRAQAVAA